MKWKNPSRRPGARAAMLAMMLLISSCGSSTPGVTVTDGIYRAPLGAADIGVGYFTIQAEQADRIVSIGSPLAQSVEMHETVLTGTSSSMQQRTVIDLPAKTPVSFAPGGLHLMIFSPQHTENETTFPLDVQLESGQTLHVRLNVETGPPARS